VGHKAVVACRLCVAHQVLFPMWHCQRWGCIIFKALTAVHCADMQVVLVNSSVLYYNPSDTDTCVEYTQKRIFAFRQVSHSMRFASTAGRRAASLVCGTNNCTRAVPQLSAPVMCQWQGPGLMVWLHTAHGLSEKQGT
jgi:hypothetical protein